MSELNLFQKIASGDESAFDVLFKQYYTRLVSVSYNIVKQKDIAEDIVQKIFTDLWLKKSEIIITTSIEAYLKKAAIFKSIDFIRKQKKEREKQNQFKASPPSSKTFSPEEILLQEERIQDIYKKIDSLPSHCKTAFKLSRFDQLSYQEIAEKLGISKKTVEYHISKAMQILRDSIFIFLVISFIISYL